MEDLWVQANIDGNGVVDYNEFQVNTSFAIVCMSPYDMKQERYLKLFLNHLHQIQGRSRTCLSFGLGNSI